MDRAANPKDAITGRANDPVTCRAVCRQQHGGVVVKAQQYVRVGHLGADNCRALDLFVDRQSHGQAMMDVAVRTAADRDQSVHNPPTQRLGSRRGDDVGHETQLICQSTGEK